MRRKLRAATATRFTAPADARTLTVWTKISTARKLPGNHRTGGSAAGADRRGQMNRPENRNGNARAQSGITRRQALAGVASAAALTAIGGGTALAAKKVKVAAV